MNSTTASKLSLLLVFSLLLPSCLGGLPNSKEDQQEVTDEDRIRLYTSTANYHYEDDELDRAQSQAVKVLELDPYNKPMRRMVGWIRVRKGSNADLLIAKDFFEGLRDEGDDNQSTSLGMATTLERLGVAYEQAAGRVERGEQLPDDGLTQSKSASKLKAKSVELFIESRDAYNEVVTDDEGPLTAINGLQRVHALLGEYQESLHYSERLLQASREECEWYRTRLTRGELTEEEDLLYRENERIGEDLQTQTHLFAATVLHDLGRDEEARKHLNDVLEIYPEMAQVYSRRAQLAASAGDYQSAIQDLDRYLGLSTEDATHPDVVHAFDLRSDYARKLALNGTSSR